MKDTLYYIVSSIADNKDGVKIKEDEENGVITFTVSVAKEDMGKIIGKGGKVIKAIRNVMKIPAIKTNRKIFITLSENPQ